VDWLCSECYLAYLALFIWEILKAVFYWCNFDTIMSGYNLNQSSCFVLDLTYLLKISRFCLWESQCPLFLSKNKIAKLDKEDLNVDGWNATKYFNLSWPWTKTVSCTVQGNTLLLTYLYGQTCNFLQDSNCSSFEEPIAEQ
jgi:hypothetical protein